MTRKILILALFAMAMIVPSILITPEVFMSPASEAGDDSIPIEYESHFTSAWLLGWQYRKAHIIRGESGVGSGYQVRISVRYGSGIDSSDNVYLDSKCQTDFDDIRFTNDDQTTLLPYWRESYSSSNYANFWVKIEDSLDSDVTIFLYYGNSTATSLSDADLVFDMYDGFDRADSASVGNGWMEDEGPSPGATSISSNQLRIYQYQDYYCHIEKPAPSLSNLVFQGKLYHGSYSGASWMPSIHVYWDTYDWIRIGSGSSHQAVYNDGGNPAGYSSGSASTNTWYYYRIRLTDDYAYADYSTDGITWVNVLTHARAVSWEGPPALVLIGKGYSGSPNYPNVDLDNNYATTASIGTHYGDDVFVRKYVSSAEPNQGEWGGEVTEDSENWLSGWQYRKSHTIQGSLGAGQGYQVRVVVHYGFGTDESEHVYLGGKCNSDFSDIRFIDTTNLLQLGYWLQEKADSNYAVFWVRISKDLGSEQSFYLYYGNIFSESESNGDATFMFFDDFNDGVFDSTTWMEWSTLTAGTPSEANGLMTYTNPSGWGSLGTVNKLFPINTAFGGYGKTSADSNYWWFNRHGCGNPVTGQIAIGYDGAYGGAQYEARDVDTTYTARSTVYTSFVSFEVQWMPGKARFYEEGSLKATLTSNVPNNGDLGIGMIVSGTHTLSWDWVYIRKCIDAEPNHGEWGSEEYTAQANQPSGWLSGWEFRKILQIDAGLGAGTNYQLRFNVYYGQGVDIGSTVYCNFKCKADFSDIRFTSSNGTTVLDHWVERYTESSLAVIWVEVREDLDYNQIICFYYGNPAARSVSNGANTFLIFDDFDDGVITDWILDTPVGSITESSGTLILEIPSGVNGNWWSTTTEFAPIAYQAAPTGRWIAETKLNSYSVSTYTHAGIMLYQNRDNVIKSGRYRSTSYNRHQVERIYQDSGLGTLGYYSSTSLPSQLRIRNTGTTKYYDASVNSGSSWSQMYSSSYVTPDYVGLFVKNWGTYPLVSAPFDWFHVRKFAATEPSFGSWTPEQQKGLDDWGYYKSHIISATTGVNSGYQMKISVNFGIGVDSGENVYCNFKCKPDFDDIRFADSTRLNMLDYWRESYTLGTKATFWVELNEPLDEDRTIYMYYGNADANTTSDGFETMSRWASYNADDTESPQSTYTYLGGSTIVDQEKLFISTSGTSYSQYRIFNQILSNDDRFLRVRFQPVSLGNNMYRFQPGMFVYQTTSLQGTAYWAESLLWDDAGLWLFYTMSSGSSIQFTPLSSTHINLNHWYDVSLSVSGTSCHVMVYDENTSSTIVDTITSVYNHDSTSLYASFGQYSGPNPGTVEAWYDDIYMRKYVSTGPAHGDWGDETINEAGVTDSPILITNNQMFLYYATQGDGTPQNPYVMDGYNIRTRFTCVEIINTTAYFILANSTLSSGLSIARGWGLSLANVTNGRIVNTLIRLKEIGVLVSNCTDISIDGNSLEKNDIGISICNGSFNTTVSTNTIDDCTVSSVLLSDALLSNITQNEFSNMGLMISGSFLQNWNHNITLNTMNGKPILYLWNQRDSIYDGGTYSQVILAFCYNVTITSGQFQNVATGIMLGFTNDSLIYDNIIRGSEIYGIFIYEGQDNILANNTVSNGKGTGLWLNGAPGSQITNNSVYGLDLYGILVENSSSTVSTGLKVWQNRIGYNILGNAYDNGSSNLWDDDISIGNTWNDYGGAGVYNIPGNANSVDRYPNQLLYPSPTISGPSDFPIEFATSGNSIEWTTESSFPHRYVAYQNDTQVESSDWFGGTLLLFVDGLAVNTYNYTVIVFDHAGFNSSDSVILTVRDTLAPSISSPLPLTYDFGSTGHTLSWNMSDPSFSFYEIQRNGTHVVTGYTAAAFISIDGLDLGKHNYSITACDLYGNNASDSIWVTVIDGTFPLIDSPSDFIYEFGMTGINVTWNPSDLFPINYDVLQNGSSIQSGPWDGGQVSAIASPLIMGLHNFTVIVTDVGGNNVSDTILVTVESEAPPAMSSPDDFWYQVDTVGNQINWTCWDRHPGVYQVYRNGTSLDSDSWSNGLWILNIDGLEPGSIYNFTLVLGDQLQNNSTDTVFVRVRDLTPPTINSPSDIFYEYGRMDVNPIQWIPSDLYLSHYTLYLDDIFIDTVPWIGGNIVWGIDVLLAPGTHNFTVIIFDVDYNNASDTVMVEVYPSFPPTIDHPIDATIELGTTRVITWNPSDVSIGSYTIYVDGISNDTGPWYGESISFSFTKTTSGTYNITVKVEDAAGNWSSDTVIITIEDTTNPVIADTENWIWIQGEQIPAQTLYWYAYDLQPGTFFVYLDGSEDANGQWSNGEAISYTFSTIPTWGDHVVFISIIDADGNLANSTVLFIPHSLLDFEEPNDITIEFEDDEAIQWTLLAGSPSQYWLTIDYVSVESGNWTGSEKTVNLDQLPIGIHHISIAVVDTLGLWYSDEVVVNVEGSMLTGTTPHGEPQDYTWALIAIPVTLVGVVVIICLIQKRKSS
ncbi:MAG: DUF2341 domain-containing protein [Candidatus Thorarchaeota archaeon]